MNSNIFKKIALLLLAVLVLLQFVQPGRNQGNAAGLNDITHAVTVPEGILQTLEKSCYDRHSNNTVYPWYASIQPVGLWLKNHVDEGKEELNFSEFNTYTAKRKAHKMEEIAEMLEEDEMPLPTYTFIHKEAILNATQKADMIAWAKENHLKLKQGNTENSQAAPDSESGEHQD